MIYLSIAVTTTGSVGGCSLISIPDATVASITFAASSVVANAGIYTVTVQTGFIPDF